MFINNANKIDNFLIILFSILPLSILSGNLFINLNILCISLIFIFKLIKKETNIFDYKESYNLFFILLFFFFSLLINLIFSNNIFYSYQRITKIFFIIFFILAFKFIVLNYYKNLDKIYKIWSIFYIIVILDLIFEFFCWRKHFWSNSYRSRKTRKFYRKRECDWILLFGILSNISLLYI